jgi:hypothetical protein
MKSSNLKTLTLTTSCAGVFALGLSALPASAFWGDHATEEDGPHSTFHYEFTRTLARAAGFSAADAEFLGVMAEVTDRMQFQGTGLESPMVSMWGTERAGPTDGYFHWPRKGVMNVTGEYTLPGGRDTCAYFTGSMSSYGRFGIIASPDPCVGGPELHEIERWTMFGQGAPAVGTPIIEINAVPLGPVQGGSLASLGIYLHAVADAYSHEPCMKSKKIRGHRQTTTIESVECSVVRWHENEEFGPPGSFTNRGTTYTIEAGKAVWQALKYYRTSHGLAGAPLWTDVQADAFVDNWAKLDAPADRDALAVSAYLNMP